jgi:tetratricopeptide (TPR) repeat protein
MNRPRLRTALLAGLAALLLLGASPPPADPEALLRDGDAAYARGDFAAAAELYEQASLRTTDPARAALRLAGARYRLALRAEGPSHDLQEAEELFRCCCEPGEPQRDRALFGLGNCLTLKAAGRDAAALQAALDCYEQCLRATEDPELTAAARYNRERTRLLLLQVQPQPEGGQRPAGNDNAEPPPRPEPQPSNGRPGDTEAGADGQDDGLAGGLRPEQGTAPVRSDGTPPPGKGDLPPVPDQAEPAALSAAAAARHLQEAHERIDKERRTYRRQVRHSLPEGIPAW